MYNRIIINGGERNGNIILLTLVSLVVLVNPSVPFLASTPVKSIPLEATNVSIVVVVQQFVLRMLANRNKTVLNEPKRRPRQRSSFFVILHTLFINYMESLNEMRILNM